MIFNSVAYLLFFPVVACIYFLIPKSFKRVWLLVASYYFYMNWNAGYSLLMLFSTITTYFCGFFVSYFGKKEQKNYQKLSMFFCIVINLLILFLFKYFNFTSLFMNKIFHFLDIPVSIPIIDLLLPVGISFYTFQALGYIIDVYRKEIEHEKNFITYALFVSFFPQLVAGPIETASNLLPQLKKVHTFCYDRTVKGLRMILYGLFKKVVIADTAAIFVNAIFNNVYQYRGLSLCMAIFLFSIQIYCDFSGYSEIAMGSAKILGVDLMENFHAPYFSSSIGEFWNRWHISLNEWFKKYVYIPLGGSQKGFLKKCRNLFIIFLLSGLWHGAAWTFVAWGILNGGYRIVQELIKKTIKPIEFHYKFLYSVKKIIKILFTYILVCFSWIFFRANCFGDAIYVIKNLFQNIHFILLKQDCITIIKENLMDGSSIYYFYYSVLFLSIIFLFLIDLIRSSKKNKNIKLEEILFRNHNKILRWGIYIFLTIEIIFLFLIQNGIYGQTGQFIYFQF